jgi:hypothetical protein
MPADRTREHCSVSGRMISGLRPESKTLANKFAPTGPVSLSRSAAVNARNCPRCRFCRRRRSLACRRSGAKRQHMIRLRLTLLGRIISRLRPESKTLANKFAPTGPVLLARFAAVNARNCPRCRFCRRRRSLACRRSGAKRQHMIRLRLTLLGRIISRLRPESKTLANKFAPTGPVLLARSAFVNARELSGSRFCRKRRSLACRRSGTAFAGFMTAAVGRDPGAIVGKRSQP